MRKANRKLYPYEKVLLGFRIFMLLVGIAFFIVSIVNSYRWANFVFWMCACVSNIVSDCIRWDERTKLNVIDICFWAVFLVIFSIQFVLPI